MYAFLLDRRSLTLLVVGNVLAGGLLFFGGFLLGMRVNLPPEPEPVAEFVPLSRVLAPMGKKVEAAEGSAAKKLEAVEGSAAKKLEAAVDKIEKVIPLALPPPAAAEPPAGEGSDSQSSAAALRAEPAAASAREPVRIAFSTPAAAAVEEGTAPASSPAARGEDPPAATPAPASPVAAGAGEWFERVAESDGSPPANGAGFSLQVGAFAVLENAVELVSRLRGQGYDAYLVPAKAGSGQLLTTVRVGRYGSFQLALRAQAAFRQSQGDAVVRWPESIDDPRRGS